MENQYIDLRSDTTSLPDKQTVYSMLEAEVGDFAYGEDRACNDLVEYCKELFKVEDAIFVTSGMLANRLAIITQTMPGDELITHYNYHINFFDSAGNAKVSNIVFNPINNDSGILDIEEVDKAIESKPRYHTFAQVKLVSIENSINGFNGKIYPLESQKELYNYLQGKNINMHLDGARIFNSHITSGTSLVDYAKYTDTLSFCFAKGLGGPFGSMLLGKRSIIEQARKHQIWLGSGYHQIGYYANAAKYVLQNNINKLRQDHRLTKLLAEKIKEIPGLKLLYPYPETNILSFSIELLSTNNDQFLEQCKLQGLLLFPWLKNKIRAVINSNIAEEQVLKAAQTIETVTDIFLNNQT